MSVCQELLPSASAESESCAASAVDLQHAPAAQLAIIRQMSGQVSRGSAGEYQEDERAGVGRLTYRVSGR